MLGCKLVPPCTATDEVLWFKALKPIYSNVDTVIHSILSIPIFLSFRSGCLKGEVVRLGVVGGDKGRSDLFNCMTLGLCVKEKEITTPFFSDTW